MLCSQWLVTGVTCNDVRGAAGQHALDGSQIKRRVNELSMMLKLGRVTRFDNIHLSIIISLTPSRACHPLSWPRVRPQLSAINRRSDHRFVSSSSGRKA